MTAALKPRLSATRCICVLLGCAALALADCLHANDATAEFEALRKLHAAQWTDHAKRVSPEHMHWLGERARQLRELGTDFLATHPTDPRRWDVLVMLQHSGVQRAANPNPGGSLLSSPARETALWQQRYFSMLEDLLEAPDASRPARHGALMQLTAMVPISAGRSNVPEHRRFDAAR